jgi:hypothetical protein
MAAEQRKCPYCGMSMAADQRSCPDCGNPYPFDDEAPPEPQTGPFRPQRADISRGGGGGGGAAASAAPGAPRPSGRRGGGVLEAIAPYRTALVLATVLILIVVVAYVLFSVVMSFFGERRPDPSTLPTPVAGPVLVPPLGASPVPGASPSPGTGTGAVISPAASPSPGSAPGVKMKIARTENQGANMRQRPSTTAPVMKTLAEGTVVEVIGGDTNAEGRNWRNIRESGGQTGWVASELLMPE